MSQCRLCWRSVHHLSKYGLCHKHSKELQQLKWRGGGTFLASAASVNEGALWLAEQERKELEELLRELAAGRVITARHADHRTSDNDDEITRVDFMLRHFERLAGPRYMERQRKRERKPRR